MVEFQKKRCQINPDNAETHYGIGGVLLQKGQLDAFIAEYPALIVLSCCRGAL